MSEQEIEQQKARLLLEHFNVAQYLAHLKEKAQFTANLISDFHTAFAGSAGVQGGRGAFSWPPDDRHRDAMNFDAAMALLTEIEETQSKLDDLTRRKTSLGLAL